MPEQLPDFTKEHPPVKPKEAVEFWKTRTPLTESQLKQLDAGARDRAFTVAGLAKQDQVALVHKALQDALENGTTLADFKKQLGPLIREHGWTNYRLDTIFRTNLQTAYAAGRYAQMQSAKEYLPYWEYFTVGDDRVRPGHAALDGFVFPADHEFWDSNYPPNGYKCRCGVRAVSGREVERLGLTVQNEMPSDLMYTDPQTGMEYRVAMPGAKGSFASNPGKDWLSGLNASQVDLQIGDKTSGALLCRSPKNFSSVEEGSACFFSMADIPERHIIKVTSKDLLPGNLTQMAYMNAFLGEFGIKYGQSKLFKLPGVNLPLVINERLFLDKKANVFKVARQGRERYLKLLAQTIKNPFEIWMHPTVMPNGRKADTLTMLRLFMLEDEGRKVGGLGIFRLHNGREWSGSTVFMPKVNAREEDVFKYLDELRLKALLEHGNAALVYREK